MDLGTLLTSSLTDTLDVSLPHFRTELALSATIVLVLLCRMLPVLRWLDSGFVALGGVAFALWYAWCDFRGLPGSPWATIAATQPGSMELFGGLLVFDSLTAYIRLLLAGFLVLYILFTKVSGIPDPEGCRRAVTALAFYLATYLFMNLGAFAIVAVLRNRLRSEEIASYAGLVRTNPGLVVAAVAVLVSLIGLPPLAGFVSKFLVFSSLVDAITKGIERPLMLVLLVVGGLNTVISLFYYLRVLKVMTFDPPSDARVAAAAPVWLPGALVTAVVVPVVLLGIFWSGLYAVAQLAGTFAS